jgi:hypothetical protein
MAVVGYAKVAEVGERLLQPDAAQPDAADRFGGGIIEDVEEYKSKRHRAAN